MKNIFTIKNKIRSLVSIGLGAYIVVACSPSLEPQPGTGSLGTLVPEGQKVRLVTVGNSLTAGMQSSGCYAEAMEYTFPYLLAQALGAEDFVQPQWDAQGSGSQVVNGVRSRQEFRGFNASGSPQVAWVPAAQQAPLNATLERPYNNLGVPGAITADLLDTSNFIARSTQRQNPYYAQVLRNSALGRSIVEQAIALQPNVMTVWMGNNDLLGYAASGGTQAMNGAGTLPAPTQPEAFALFYESAFRILTASLPNTKILVLSLPDVVNTPFFNTVPWNGLAIPRQSLADSLTAFYAGSGFQFQVGQNPFIVADANAPGGRRLATAQDKIILPALTPIQTQGLGSIIPLPNNLVLSQQEIEATRSAWRSYNETIRRTADQYPNVYLVDIATIMQQINERGYPIPGFSPITPAYISGGLFSLDGLHLTSRGYGAIANEIIKTINSSFSANVPLVLLSNIPALQVKAAQ